MNNFTKTLKGLSSQTFVTIIMGILELIVFSLMSRLLTRSEFGMYAILQSVIMIFRCLSEAGLGAAIIQKKETTFKFIDTAFTLSIGFGLLFTIIFLCLAKPVVCFYENSDLFVPFCLIAASVIPYSLNSIFRSLIIKRLEFLKHGTIQIISYLFSNMVGVFLAYYSYGVYALVISNMLYIVSQTILLWINSKNKPHLAFSIIDSKMILSYGCWLTFTRFLTQLYAQIDKLLIAKLLSVYSLGVFYRIRGLIDSIDSQIGGVFDTTLFPILSDIQDRKDVIQRAFLKSTYFTGIFFSLLFLTFLFNSRLIIVLFLGEQWLDQISIFQILSFSMFIYFLNRLDDCFIRSMAYLKFAFRLKILSILLLVISIYVMSKYGCEGIAISICMTNLIVCLIKTIYICKKININFIKLIINLSYSFRYSLPIISFGIVYYSIFQQNMINDVVFAILFAMLCIIIFVLFPSLVGDQYKELIYIKFKNKLLNYGK